MPVAATRHTPVGARAFAVFVMRTMDWGYATVSGAYLRHYAAAECAGCARVSTTQDNARRQGHRFVGDRSTIVGARSGSGGPLHAQIVTINSTAFEELTKNGDYVTGDQAYRGQQWRLGLRWDHGRWSATSLAVRQ